MCEVMKNRYQSAVEWDQCTRSVYSRIDSAPNKELLMKNVEKKYRNKLVKFKPEGKSDKKSKERKRKKEEEKEEEEEKEKQKLPIPAEFHRV